MTTKPLTSARREYHYSLVIKKDFKDNIIIKYTPKRTKLRHFPPQKKKNLINTSPNPHRNCCAIKFSQLKNNTIARAYSFTCALLTYGHVQSPSYQ